MLIISILLSRSCSSEMNERPNIIWITSEDISIYHMKLYNENGVSMPAIEKLASQGVLFNNAFSNSPVCSVARSTLITGCYAPRIFTQYHRRAEYVPLPKNIKPLPYYLKKSGYYTTNNNKQDYNFILPNEVWDESSKEASYRNRKPNQPFFHVQNYAVTHEGNLHFDQETLDNVDDKEIKQIEVFPYHPDTKTFRFSYKLFNEKQKLADNQIEDFLGELKKQGLLDDTIIFYFGDHGGVLPRSKGYAYESGLQVPLVVYIPNKWKNLIPFERGSRSNIFFEFIDMAPTVLALAGVPIPEDMDGIPLMGNMIKKNQIEKKNSAFGYADRFDEKYDFVRTLRIGKYKYIRNYQPFNMDALYNNYRYKMLAYKEWLNHYKEGKLNKIQSQFFESRSPEALFNIEEDPHEVNDISKNINYGKILKQMRKELRKRLLAMPDLSFYPESHLLENALENPTKFGKKQQKEIVELIAIADLNLAPYEKVKEEIKNTLVNKNPWKRYWGLVVCSSFGDKALDFAPQIKKIFMEDEENLVKIRAAEYLMLNQISIDKKQLEKLLKNSKSETEANLMLNSLSLVKAIEPNIKFNFSKEIFPSEWLDNKNDLVNIRMNYLID